MVTFLKTNRNRKHILPSNRLFSTPFLSFASLRLFPSLSIPFVWLASWHARTQTSRRPLSSNLRNSGIFRVAECHKGKEGEQERGKGEESCFATRNEKWVTKRRNTSDGVELLFPSFGSVDWVWARSAGEGRKAKGEGRKAKGEGNGRIVVYAYA